MAKFFNQLVEENLITEWAETLDWLFDDLKFSKERNWNSGYTGQFTKRLKRLHGLDKENYIYKNNSTIDFPSLMENNRNNRVPMIVMVQGDSAARDFIRHILFFASTFWTKLQNIFGHCCMSKLDKIAKPRLAAYKPAESHCRHYLIVTA